MAPPPLPPPPMPRRSTFVDNNIQQPAVTADSDEDDDDSSSSHDSFRNSSGNHGSGDGGRSTSTTLRLQGQGFRRSQRHLDFAVRSIRRGSRQWNELLKLFVADLAFRSVVTRRFQSEVSFRPYTCDAAAVLFVDLSHYSRIAAAVVGNNNQHGAHALSTTVNDYLDRLLALVDWHGGDVVKFAGDAVLVVWEGQSQLQHNQTSSSILELNVLTAAKCVLEMLQQAGSHPVEGTDLQFRIHCGLSCGHVESEVFAAPVHSNMQRLFHSVGGDAVVEIGELVDLARAGEVCVSDEVVQILMTASRGGASFRDVEEASFAGGQILTQLDLDSSLLKTMDLHVQQLKTARAAVRDKAVEEEFIHPKVIHLLSHSGQSPSQISQIRNLCVLFIAMTSNGSSVNWLMEVQSILDKNRCPIVQIIDDDKGVHLVAAGLLLHVLFIKNTANLIDSLTQINLLLFWNTDSKSLRVHSRVQLVWIGSLSRTCGKAGWLCYWNGIRIHFLWCYWVGFSRLSVGHHWCTTSSRRTFNAICPPVGHRSRNRPVCVR